MMGPSGGGKSELALPPRRRGGPIEAACTVRASSAGATTFHLDDEVAPLKHVGVSVDDFGVVRAFHLDDEVAPLKH